MTWHRHEEQPLESPFDRCRTLLIHLRQEQMHKTPSPDRLANLYSQITMFPFRTIMAAFDNVVDTCGWGGDNGITPDAD